MRVAAPVNISPEERTQIGRLIADPTVSPRTQLRAWIVLRAAEGAKNRSIAREFLVNVDTVGLWRRRFLVHRLPGILADAPRAGRKPRISASVVARIVSASQRTPVSGAEMPSSRDIARGMKVSQSTVVRIWRTHQLRVPGGALPGPEVGTFVGRPVRDLRGMYLVGADRAVVFVAPRIPEYGGAIALSPSSASSARPGPSLGSRAPPSRRANRDPLAALRVLYRTRLAYPGDRDRVQEFLLFLRGVALSLGRDEEAYVVLCSDRLGKEPDVLRWLQRHPGLILYSGRPNAVGEPAELVLPEGLFLRPGRGGSLRALSGLVDAFRQYVASYERHPRPFVWRSVGPAATAGPEARATGARPSAERLPESSPSSSPTGGAVAPSVVPSLSFPTFPSTVSGGFRGSVEPHSGQFPSWLKSPLGTIRPISPPSGSRSSSPAEPIGPERGLPSAASAPVFAPFLLGGRIGRPPNRPPGESV